MRFSVREQFLSSKRGDPDGGEDGIFVNDAYVVVVDGASAKDTWFLSTHDAPARSDVQPGRLCRDTLLDALAALPPDLDGWDFVRRLNDAVDRLRQRMPQGAGVPQANVVAFSAARGEVWSFGDCACIVAGEVHSERKAIDVRHAAQRSAVLREALAKGATVGDLLARDEGRLAILDGLQSQQALANAADPFGYPVLDGGAIRREDLVTYRVPAPCEVVLASDGYPHLLPTLEESEEDRAAVVAADPLMMRIAPETKGVYPGQVSYDDRAYVRISVQP